MHWKSIITYTATYKAGKKGKGKATLIVRTINKPPPLQREFRLASTEPKLFTRIKLTKSTRKAIIIMATKTKGKKSRDKTVEDETLEELTDLEDVEELEEDEDETVEEETPKKKGKKKSSKKAEAESDDDEDEDEDTDDDDDEEVEKPKKNKKSKGKTTRAKANGKIGTQELAEHCGVDSRTLRMVLRKHSIDKDPETGRYEWSSLDHADVKKVKKLIDKGEAKNIKKESLDKLKEKKAAEGGKKKKNKKNKKKKAEADDDE